MKFRLFLFLILLNTSITHAFQNPVEGDSLLKTITTKLANYVTLEGPEKTYVYTDKDIYRPGDTIWFKTYMVDGITHQKSDKSKVAYLELLNSEDSILAKRRLFIEDMSSFGSIEIPKELNEGNFKLRAYTKYMLNDEKMPIYQKWATISSKKMASKEDNAEERMGKGPVDTTSTSLNRSDRTVNVKFFPEGGNLVAGLPGGLAFRVSDVGDNPIATQGSIKDAKGNVITQFSSNDHGMGIVYFMPETGNSYYALIEDNGLLQRFKIPPILPNGFSLSIKNRGENILIQVESTEENTLEGTLLIGHLRGRKIFGRLEKNNKGTFYAVKLLTKNLPDGIASFTLFTSEGKPVCERLVFIHNQSNDPKVTIRTDTDSLGNREKIQLAISVIDANGRPVKGDFSMRVSSSLSLNGKSDMKSWLSLNSDLDGTIYDASLFFQKNSKETRLLLDIIMLTHSWEKFSWNGLLGGQHKTHAEFSAEKGIMIRGTSRDIKTGAILGNNMISLNILSESFEEKQATDEKGRFSFGPYFFNDSITAILQIVDDNKKQGGTPSKINFDPQWPQIHSKPIINNHKPLGIDNSNIQQSVAPDFKENTVEEYESEITYLDEVVVKEKRKTKAELIEKELNSLTPYGGYPDKRIFRDSIKGREGLSALDMLARKGYRVVGDFPNQKISLSGGNPSSTNSEEGPLVLVDGTPVNGILGSIRASEVLFIDVLRFASASFYGVRGSNGVIAVYMNRTLSNSDFDQGPNPRITNTKIMGFDKKQEFHPHDYADAKKYATIKDYRTTLYWDPEVELDNEGQSNIQFYTNDTTGIFTIELEGITSNGEIVHGSYDIEVNNKR